MTRLILLSLVVFACNSSNERFMGSIKWNLPGEWESKMIVPKVIVDYVTIDTMQHNFIFNPDLSKLTFRTNSSSHELNIEWVGEDEFRLINMIDKSEIFQRKVEHVDEHILVLSGRGEKGNLLDTLKRVQKKQGP